MRTRIIRSDAWNGKWVVQGWFPTEVWADLGDPVETYNDAVTKEQEWEQDALERAEYEALTDEGRELYDEVGQDGATHADAMRACEGRAMMDPNAALARIRELTAQITDRPNTISTYSSDTAKRYSVVDAAQELAETINGLDEWIQNGGFLPTDWQR